MCICACLYVHTQVHARIRTCTSIYIYIYIYMYIHVHAHVHIHVYTCTCTRTRTYSYTYTCIYTYIYILIYIYFRLLTLPCRILWWRIWLVSCWKAQRAHTWPLDDWPRYVCMCVCVYERMNECMYVCLCLYIYAFIQPCTTSRTETNARNYLHTKASTIFISGSFLYSSKNLRLNSSGWGPKSCPLLLKTCRAFVCLCAWVV